MRVIGQRELRNDSGAIMRRVELGESFVVTRNGTPVADLVPHDSDGTARRPRFVPVPAIAAGFDALPSWAAQQFARDRDDLDLALDDPDRDAWTSA